METNLIMNSEQEIYKKITIIIVTFHSKYIIDKCLNNLDKNFKIILAENSDDTTFTQQLMNKYNNVFSFTIGYDAGFGYAVNKALEKVKTEYFVCLNPDSFPDKDCINQIFKTIKRKECGMVVPITIKENGKESTEYGGFFGEKISKDKDKDNLLQVDRVSGNLFIMNTNFFNKIGKFDENIFVNFEETDLQKRIKDNKKEVLVDYNAKTKHLEGKSADPSLQYFLKCEGAWHFSWSQFYFFKKHYGFRRAFNLTFSSFIKNSLRFLYYFFHNKRQSKISLLHSKGFIYALLNKSPSYRAEINQFPK